MLLSREQVKHLLMSRNIPAHEVCDECSTVLGSVRFTSAKKRAHGAAENVETEKTHGSQAGAEVAKSH